MRAFVLAVGLVVAATCAVSAKDDLGAFAKQVDGVWSRLPSPPLQPFPVRDLEAGLRQCSTPQGKFIRFEMAKDKLAFMQTGVPAVIVVRARRGPARNGFDSWALVTNNATFPMLVRRGAQLSLIMTDEGSYVRCPVRAKSGEAKPVTPTKP